MKIELVPVADALEALLNDEPAYILIEINENTTAAELNMADRYMVIRDAIPPVSEHEPEPVKQDPVPDPEQEPKKPKPKSQQKVQLKNPKKDQPKIDHGKIVALAKAGWSATKIADEMGCSCQTVLNHLKKEAQEQPDA